MTTATRATCDLTDGELLASLPLDAAQSARHTACLAIARWRRGLSQTDMQIAVALSDTPQARWYARTLRHLDAWRAAQAEGDD